MLNDMRTQHVLAPSGGIMPIVLSSARSAPTSAGAYRHDFAPSRYGAAAAPATLTDHLVQIRDLGLTIESVSRTITALRSEGIVLIPNTSQIVLRDMAALRVLAAEG
jgi:hypothetical protein